MGKNFGIEIVTELKCTKLYCIWFFIGNRQDDTNLELCLESRKKENREYLEKRWCIFCLPNTIQSRPKWTGWI
jgi:hypothetical protein